MGIPWSLLYSSPPKPAVRSSQQSTPNAKFEVMNALEMTFPDNSFDIVWACESGEHMPDKKKYIDEMMRVLKVRD